MAIDTNSVNFRIMLFLIMVLVITVLVVTHWWYNRISIESNLFIPVTGTAHDVVLRAPGAEGIKHKKYKKHKKHKK